MPKDLLKRIDKLFAQNRYNSDENQQYTHLQEQINELKKQIDSLKLQLKNNTSAQSKYPNKSRSKYLDFVYSFKRYANELNNKGDYVAIYFEHGTYSIDKKGYVYDVLLGRRVSKETAFSLFAYMYEHKEHLNAIVSIKKI